ncbi:MAG: CHAT domain-containing protein [bacterium]
MAIEPGLELSILDSATPDNVIAHARCGSDIAVARIKLDASWSRLQKFRDTLDRGLRGDAERPASKDVDRFGRDLFDFVMKGDVGRLYSTLQQDQRRRQVSVSVFSDRDELQDIPWEYLQEPNSPGGPGERAVVRLLPTIGIAAPVPVAVEAGARVLFVSSDPITQQGVSWPDVEATLSRAFKAKVPAALDLRIVQGATQQAISAALRATPRCDVFHFMGHGEVRGGQGGLILTGDTPFLPADRLAAMIRGCGVRLAVLSACDTSTGSRKEPFAIVADALIRVGVSAVVANQLPIPNSTVATFVGAMYGELLATGDIDRAVTQGRKALAYELARVGGDVGIEWGIPTLHRLVGASQVYLP